MQPYIPEKLPLVDLKWMEFIHLIGNASMELARYDGILQGIVNPMLLLSPLTTQEAVISSKIEGTQATLEEVLGYEAMPQEGGTKSEDIREILNYRQSLIYALEHLQKRPINLNLCREIQFGLLDSVRGRNKLRGEFRQTQNWIGPPGTPIEKATYVPPPPDRVLEFMSNLESYIHLTEKDNLVQLAIIHAQFEIIHPFLDGNGRVGRILIPIFLVERKILSHPVFYISAYLDENRDIYYDKLNNITKNDDWEGWIVFFLTAIIEQSKKNIEMVKEILALYEKIKEEATQLLRSQYTIQAIDAIFEKPIFSTTDFIRRSGIPRASAWRIMDELKKEKIIDIFIEGKGRSPTRFVFGALMDIVA